MLTFRYDGVQRFRSAVDAGALRGVAATLDGLPTSQAGIRLHGIVALRRFLQASGPIGAVAASVLGEACRPVRAVLFDKSEAANWLLAWH